MLAILRNYILPLGKRLYATDKNIIILDTDYLENTELQRERIGKRPKYYQPHALNNTQSLK